jgi:hypothetical protein
MVLGAPYVMEIMNIKFISTLSYLTAIDLARFCSHKLCHYILYIQYFVAEVIFSLTGEDPL